MSLHEPFNNVPYIPEALKQDNIGRQFQAAREAKNLSQEQLARAADVSLLALKMWETGPQSMDVLQRLLGALDQHLVVTKTRIVLMNPSVLSNLNE